MVLPPVGWVLGSVGCPGVTGGGWVVGGGVVEGGLLVEFCCGVVGGGDSVEFCCGVVGGWMDVMFWTRVEFCGRRTLGLTSWSIESEVLGPDPPSPE